MGTPADRGGSADTSQATVDSDSARTAEDSGSDDEVYSDLEYSRVISSPAPDNNGASRSTPKTPRSATKARNTHNETPTAVRKPSGRGQRVKDSSKNGGAGDASLAETQTQKLPPLTASQLRMLGLGFPELDNTPLQTQEHEPESEPQPELERELEEPQPERDAGPEPQHESQRKPQPQSQVEESGVQSDEEPEFINSDDERVSSGSEELGTPHVAQLGGGSYGSGGIVDETPMRHQPFTVSQYAYILCLWQRRWYPARAQRVDYEESRLSTQRELAPVTFADGTAGACDLRQAVEFDLRVGDRVQIEGDSYKGKRFEVVHLISDDSISSPVRTSSGHSMVRLRTLAPSRTAASQPTAVVEAGALSLTKSDFDLWKSTRAADLHLRDGLASPKEHRAGRLARGKRRADTSDPYEKTRTRRRKVAGSRQPSFQSAASDEAEQLPRRIFNNCVFSISMSDLADEESAEIRQLIIAHGGTVLDNGLSDVVTLTEATESGDMPSHDLQLGDAEFAAVLAEKPRRTIKYLEMLAVGWPCLMSGFIKECIGQGALIDWVPWVLPAGVSSIPRKSGAPVNANISQFQQGWLRGEKLATQFFKRRIILKCTIPICVVVSPDKREPSQELADTQRLFLASLCAAQYKLWIYQDRSDVPEGALLLQLGEKKGMKSLASERGALYQMKNLAAADNIIVRDATWLLECIINGELV